MLKTGATSRVMLPLCMSGSCIMRVPLWHEVAEALYDVHSAVAEPAMWVVLQHAGTTPLPVVPRVSKVSRKLLVPSSTSGVQPVAVVSVPGVLPPGTVAGVTLVQSK